MVFHDHDIFEDHRSVAWYNVPQFEFVCFPVIRYWLNICGRIIS